MSNQKKNRQLKRRGNSRMSVPRGLTTQDWYFVIVKTLKFSSFELLSDGFQISNPSDSFLGFMPADSVQFSALQAVYDQFAVWNSRVEVTSIEGDPLANPAASVQLCFAYDPDGGTETAANIYARRNVQKFFMTQARPTAKFGGVPGHVSDDARVQKRLFYDIAGSANKPFNIGQVTCVVSAIGPLTVKLLATLRVHLKLRGQR